MKKTQKFVAKPKNSKGVVVGKKTTRPVRSSKKMPPMPMMGKKGTLPMDEDMDMM